MAYDLYTIDELAQLSPPSWLVTPLVPARALVGLYGHYGTGKSFVTLDLAMCVAAGIPWHSLAVEQGPVLYISAEGAAGQSQRCDAWQTFHH